MPTSSPVTEATRRFQAALDDDLNTPVAVAELQGLARAINTHKAAGDRPAAAAAAGELLELGRRLGVLGLAPTEFLRKAPALRELSSQDVLTPKTSEMTDLQIEALIDERMAARAAKNFAESDRIRDVLAGRGIVLEDRSGAQRTLWRRGR